MIEEIYYWGLVVFASCSILVCLYAKIAGLRKAYKHWVETGKFFNLKEEMEKYELKKESQLDAVIGVALIVPYILLLILLILSVFWPITLPIWLFILYAKRQRRKHKLLNALKGEE